MNELRYDAGIMKRRQRFAAAYVLTFSVVGCKGKDEPTKTMNPPAPTRDAQVADGATADITPDAPAQAKRKRTVVVATTERKPAGKVDWKGAKLLGAEVEHRRVYASKDGGCYVRVENPDAKGRGDGERSEPVDCPPEMDDPAWDTCFDGTLHALADGTCICSYVGNPPPPETVATCPKQGAK